ncbi:MAG: histidine phosphatase family protein [Planctomycetota bacterium]|jgi:broad specificity phosphatase PhoE
MARFLFIRHAQSGVPGIYYGRDDVAVTEAGQEQEAELLSLLECRSFKTVLTSPLTRCNALAERAATLVGVKAEVIPELVEIHLGDWEGRSFEESSTLYQDIADQLCDYDPALAFPGGESLQGFKARVAAAWENMLKGYGHLQDEILVFCHAGVIRALLATLQGSSTRDFWAPFVTNCSATVILGEAGASQILAVGVPLGSYGDLPS